MIRPTQHHDMDGTFNWMNRGHVDAHPERRVEEREEEE